MNLEKILKTGNEVRMINGTEAFITTIDEVTGENSFTILAPYKQGHQVIVRTSEIFSVSCVTERGLYMFEVVVTDVDAASNVIIIHLRTWGEARRVQRRQAFRVRESIAVNARKYPDGKWVKTSTVDIAETGILLRFDEDCEIGQEMEMTLRLNLFGLNEILSRIKGTVVRCIPTRNREFGFRLGVQFVDLPEKARDALIKMVVLSQRDKLTYRQTKKFR
ncbi:c-di-GMP-binding flagellar brake protein YcgR, contains PilZNR and PilZ domains [Sporobacter termitidis DSM 10068]|uniref:C-di-GMP-binding flagellar brake protein YcgR, contains PilZNR and PilZ domains n=1 Tax=Sporobacter termitidis DSM 10068 TaxID=1123282 RepID=A0A1M5W788_9FIRM|nr:PilZ domain-containing protein [Sporobacter termitidis]SHH83331.1 c-di-GMP-binding flagellar brake protein YcgR, contains PilZNR and PilZ domains [Sporobacter termitidis DSM 10068]